MENNLVSVNFNTDYVITINNFSCFICRSPLVQVENNKVIENHQKGIEEIDQKINSLQALCLNQS